MTSAQDFLMAFMKELIHVKNTDQRPKIVQQWAEKLEAREAEIGRQFYERFEEEYHKLISVEVQKTVPGTREVHIDVLDVAQKAAGIQ